MTPQQLVAAAQSGDKDAFAQLWTLYRADIQGWTYAHTHNHHLAEDITSEAFLRAWKNLHRFTWQATGFPGWVATIARNLVADHYKSSHHQRSRPTDTGDDLWQHPDTDRRGDPAGVTDHSDAAEALDAALATLTGPQRRVLALRFGADMPIADTANHLGVERGAVKAMQHRATTALRRHPAIVALGVAA